MIATGNKVRYEYHIIHNIPMNVNKLMPFEQQLKILCQPKTTDRRRQVLSSIKGDKYSNNNKSNNYSKKSTTYVITTSSRKKAREGKNVRGGEGSRDPRKHPEKFCSLNHNAQSTSN